jgi:tetratricopeptide (TPR) repeat protein
LIAADHAQERGGHDEAVRFLRMALDLLPDGDRRRSRLLGRLGIVLAWALDFDEATRVATEAGEAIAEDEGKAAAAEYLADATYVCATAGGSVHAWNLARNGLAFAEARDVNWARLLSFDYERQAAEDPDHPGIPLDSAERRESARILREAHLDPFGPAPMEAVFDSRDQALESSNLAVLYLWAGEMERCLPLLEGEAAEAEAAGRLARAGRGWCFVAHCQVALGRLDEAQESVVRAEALSARLGTPLPHLLEMRESICWALDGDWQAQASAFAPLVTSTNPALAWVVAHLSGLAARAAAFLGQVEEALTHLGRVVPWLERAPAWTIMYPAMACQAAEVLWRLELGEGAALVEEALRQKVIPPDFRWPLVDGRLALAQVCALTGRHDEARGWFVEARRVLSGQGVLPLLAVCDHDEALMYARRAEPGDAERARPLVAAARRQFEELGMTGWIRRADELAARLG